LNSQDSLGRTFKAIAIWFTGLTMQATSPKTDSWIIVDWVKVRSIGDDGDTILVYTEEYNNPHTLTLEEGGLYTRPFSSTKIQLPSSDAFVKDGFLYMNVGKHPDSTVHWWLPRNKVPLDTMRQYLVQIKCTIDSGIALQIGCDYWIDDTCKDTITNHTQGWNSNWFNKNDSINDFTVPDYGSVDIKFSNAYDYGYTKDGQFYISKRFALYSGWNEETGIVEVGYWFTKDTGFHVLNLNISNNDTLLVYKEFNFTSNNSKNEYCFRFNKSQNNWEPEKAYKYHNLQDSSDVILNYNKDGYNFNTVAVDKLPTTNITQNSKNKNICDALIVKGNWIIVRLYKNRQYKISIYNLLGAKIASFKGLSQNNSMHYINSNKYLTTNGNYIISFFDGLSYYNKYIFFTK
jgi:hypothetical protein